MRRQLGADRAVGRRRGRSRPRRGCRSPRPRASRARASPTACRAHPSARPCNRPRARARASRARAGSDSCTPRSRRRPRPPLSRSSGGAGPRTCRARRGPRRSRIPRADPRTSSTTSIGPSSCGPLVLETGAPTSCTRISRSGSTLSSSAWCSWRRQRTRNAWSRDHSVVSNARRAAPIARCASATLASAATPSTRLGRGRDGLVGRAARPPAPARRRSAAALRARSSPRQAPRGRGRLR